MTTLVLTPDLILADCRITSTITMKDQSNLLVTIKGISDEYCKILVDPFSRKEDRKIKACAIFGDIEVAKTLIELARITGVSNMPATLDLLSKLKIHVPEVPTGFGWVTNAREMGWLILENGSYTMNSGVTDKPYIALGSGSEIINNQYQRELNSQSCVDESIQRAFYHAMESDQNTSTDTYDLWHSFSGLVTRHEPDQEITEVKLKAVNTLTAIGG